MNSFQAKIGWKRMGKRENKKLSFVSFRSDPTCQGKIRKNSKKIQYIKKYDYGIISRQNRLEKAEKERE